MKNILGYGSSKHNNQVVLDEYNSDLEFANTLNGFYNHFDIIDFSKEIQDFRYKLDSQHFCIDQKEVERAFLQ